VACPRETRKRQIRAGGRVQATNPAAREVEGRRARDHGGVVRGEPKGGSVKRGKAIECIDPERVDLAAYNAPVLPMVAAREARSIVGALWPEAWRDPRQARKANSVSLMVDEKF
jgi:hypothetical protein